MLRYLRITLINILFNARAISCFIIISRVLKMRNTYEIEPIFSPVMSMSNVSGTRQRRNLIIYAKFFCTHCNEVYFFVLADLRKHYGHRFYLEKGSKRKHLEIGNEDDFVYYGHKRSTEGEICRIDRATIYKYRTWKSNECTCVLWEYKISIFIS